MQDYAPRDWFWIVAGDESKAWSSAAGDYVTEYAPDRLTRIANEVELYDALARVNLTSKAPSRTFTSAEVREALLRIDAGTTGSAATAAELIAVADEIGVKLPNIA